MMGIDGVCGLFFASKNYCKCCSKNTEYEGMSKHLNEETGGTVQAIVSVWRGSIVLWWRRV